MVVKFSEYRKQRELAEGNDPKESNAELHSNVTLGDGNDFPPFVVSDDRSNREHGGQNASLAPIIRAFKNGGSWGTTKEKDGNLKDVKISGKKLYLVGGSVRDIIMGKTPKDFDLTTDATPEEIEKILEQNGFKKRDGQPNQDSKKGGYDGPSLHDAHDKSFFELGKDEHGEPFVFGVVVNGELFELATFRKDHKGGDNAKLNKVQHGTHADDAKRRDLTINQMYIQLDNPNGENKKLIDHHGGIHDIKAGNIRFVGDAKERLEEDPIRALRAVRFAHRFGKGGKSLSDADKAAIKEYINKIKDRVAPERIQAELKKALGYKDIDPTQYLKTCQELGLCDVMFPGLNKESDFPEELSGFHSSPHHVLAYMLKNNKNLRDLPNILNSLKYSNEDSDKILHLIKMLKFNPEMMGPNDLEGIMRSHLKSGLSNKNVGDWMTKVGRRNPSEADALFQHFASPRVKVGYEGGNGPFDDLLSPITGKAVPATANVIGDRKKDMEFKNFNKLLQSLSNKSS